ncbi:MAG: hypothetical protein FWD11_00355 [Micrococcales bacterium]|nr:hypothetical protein [Micrococcales bacterium]
MRRTAVIVVPLFVLALGLVSGCNQGGGQATPCPVGKWEMDNDLFALALGYDPSWDYSISGTLRFEFTETEFTGRWDMAISVSDQGATESSVIDGTFKGSWSGPDDRIEMRYTQAEGTSTWTSGGETETEALEDDGKPDFATCFGSTLLVEMGDTETTFHRK